MFAMIMIVLICSTALWKMITDLHGERDRRRRAIEKGNDFYIDRYGTKVKICPTGDYCYTLKREIKSYGPNGIQYGDVVECNPKSGKVIRNLTQERRDKLKELRAQRRREAATKGESYYIYDKNDWDGLRNEDDIASGYEFADTITNDVFLVKRTSYGNLLWNVKTKRYERIVDKELLTPKQIQYLKLLIRFSELTDVDYTSDSWRKNSYWYFSKEFHNPTKNELNIDREICRMQQVVKEKEEKKYGR